MQIQTLLLLLGTGMAQAADMTVLHYLDQDPGDPPYATRILVTADFLRMDGGDDAGDFVLLDRQQGKVMNVMRDARMAMEFVPAALPPRPASWRSRLLVQPPGPQGQTYRLWVNGTVCSEGRVDKHLAADAARALAQLKTVLAATQYRVWRDTPAEFQHDCDLANQVWDATGVPRLGLPLEEREASGRSRSLVSHTQRPFDPVLFRLPDNFGVQQAPGL